MDKKETWQEGRLSKRGLSPGSNPGQWKGVRHLGGEWDAKEGLTTAPLPPFVRIKPLQLHVYGFCLSQRFRKPRINHSIDDRVDILDPLDEG